MDWLMSHAIAIGSAMLASLVAAIGIVVRQAALQRPATPGSAGVTPQSVLRDGLWWAGTAAALSGYAFQAVALAHGSLLLVQPLLVSSLLFVLPLSAWRSHTRVTGSEWAWAMMLTASLTVFVLVGRPREGHYRPAVPSWTLAIAVAVPVVTACVIVARRTTGRVRASSLGVATAVLLGMIAVLTKACTHRYGVGGWHALLTVPAPYLLVTLAVAATVLQQWAFQAGALQASVPIMLVGEPVVAVLLGMVVLGEHLTVHNAAGIAALPAAVVAMFAATIALGREEGAHTEAAAHPEAAAHAQAHPHQPAQPEAAARAPETDSTLRR